MTGQVFGHYRILEKIGAGNMGEVFRARDERLGRDVAIKLIQPASSSNPDHLRRFEQEARAAALLSHPNIVAIYDVGLEGDTPYIVSELLEGETLRQRMAKGPIPAAQGTNYALQIVRGLIAAHERRIVHRDLKPENLFVTRDGQVKILDFGVAKRQAAEDDDRSIEIMTTVTKSGAVIGTVAYMSPEQLRGRAVDARSDIFSVGAIIYEMLSGRRAFQGETEVDTMTAVLREQPPPIELKDGEIPAAFQDIIEHCIEKEAENRFQSARDLAFALETLTVSPGTREFQDFRPKRGVAVVPWVLAGVLAAAAVILLLVAKVPREAATAAYQRITFEEGTIYSARFVPNGQSIVYASAWNNRPLQLFSTVGDSLLAQPLNLSDASLLGISPKSNELAVVLHGTHNSHLEIDDGTLARMPMAGGSPKEVLANVQWADWDAQGDLAVVHRLEGHSRLEYPIGHVLYQSSGWISHIRISPQGDKVGFMDHPAEFDDRGSVCVVDLAGKIQLRSREWESEDGLAWRNDGKEIWFTAAEKGNDRNLMASDLSGRIRMLLDLPVGITLQDVGQNGRVLVTLNSERLAMAAASLDRRNEVELSWHDWNIAKDISPDGESVLFEDSSEAAGPEYAVAVRKIDGDLPVRLGSGSAGGLSPDGKWAISISTGSPQNVTLLPLGAGLAESIPTPGLEHISNGTSRFLPDGKRIFINANEAGHATRCYLVDREGGRPRSITPEGTSCGMVSPDGRYVTGFGTNPAVALYPLDGGSVRLIPNVDPSFNPVQWTADSSAFYGYRSSEFPSRIYKVDIATGKSTVVYEIKPGSPAGVVNVAPVVVSRDGTRFVYSYNQTLSVLYLITGVR